MLDVCPKSGPKQLTQRLATRMVRNRSFTASLTRVCQPLPLAFGAASTQYQNEWLLAL
jgi:hypothetical protein